MIRNNIAVLLTIPMAAILSQAQTAHPPAITATVEQTATPIGGKPVKTLSAFYRDGQGRTRTESGSSVLIQDPVAGVTIRLDTANRVARLASLKPLNRAGSPSMQPPKSPVSNGTNLRPYVDNVMSLGSQVMSGHTVVGQRHSMNYPPGTLGSIRFRKVTTDRWQSAELGISMLTKVLDSVTGETDTAFANIVIDPVLDSSLFETPDGYQVISAQ